MEDSGEDHAPTAFIPEERTPLLVRQKTRRASGSQIVAYIRTPQTLLCGPLMGSAGAPNVKRAKICVFFLNETDSVCLTEDAISCLCCETGDSVH